MQTNKSRVQILVAKFTNSMGLPFQKLLPESLIEDILVQEKIKYRQRLFSRLCYSLGIFVTGSIHR